MRDNNLFNTGQVLGFPNFQFSGTGSAPSPPISDPYLIIEYGQSNSSGAEAFPILTGPGVANQNIQMLNTGLRWIGYSTNVSGFTTLSLTAQLDPDGGGTIQLGETGSGGGGQWLWTQYSTPTIWVNGARSGFTSTNLAPGTTAFTIMINMAKSVQTLGTSVIAKYMPFNHGESDESFNITGWTTNYANILATTRTQLSSPTLKMGLVQIAGITMVTSTINHNGIVVDMVNNQPDDYWLIGPEYPYHGLNFTVSTTTLHMNGFMQRARGALIAEQIRRQEQGTWVNWKVLGATRTGTQVDITITVPQPPLVIDVTNVNRVLNYGWRYFENASGSVLGTGVTVLSSSIINTGVTTGNAIIRLELASTPTLGNERARVAWSLDRTNNNNILGTQLSNFRDSMCSATFLDIPPAFLCNWLPHLNITVV